MSPAWKTALDRHLACPVPRIEPCGYGVAHYDWALQVTAKTLISLGYGVVESFELAESVSGSPRERLEQIHQQIYGKTGRLHNVTRRGVRR